jgi:hypothetical protein
MSRTRMTVGQQHEQLANDIAEALDSDEFPQIAGADGSITGEAILVCLTEFLENASRIQHQINEQAARNSDKPVAAITTPTHAPGTRYPCKADDCLSGEVGTPDFTCSKCGQRHGLFTAF